MLDAYAAAMGFIGRNDLGDAASVVGLVITLVGFVVAIVKIQRSSEAARQAAVAAQQARDEIVHLQTTIKLTSVIERLGEIKTSQRDRNWRSLPEKYHRLKADLINVRERYTMLNDEQRTVIQSAITLLAQSEYVIDRALEANTALEKFAASNRKISENLDKLSVVLHDLESMRNER